MAFFSKDFKWEHHVGFEAAAWYWHFIERDFDPLYSFLLFFEWFGCFLLSFVRVCLFLARGRPK